MCKLFDHYLLESFLNLCLCSRFNHSLVLKKLGRDVGLDVLKPGSYIKHPNFTVQLQPSWSVSDIHFKPSHILGCLWSSVSRSGGVDTSVDSWTQKASNLHQNGLSFLATV